MNVQRICAAAALLLLSAGNLHADSEGGNFPFVQAATTDGTTAHGGFYAKCIPAGVFGANGVTRVYRVEEEQDVLVHTYNWYTPSIHISGANKKVSIVRFGPWSPGHSASKDHLALAFYYDGQFLKSYSTLDIVGQPENVQSTFSHYSWYKRRIGYGRCALPPSARTIYGFAIETLDGHKLWFDVTSGEMLKGFKGVRRIVESTSSSTNFVVTVEYDD